MLIIRNFLSSIYNFAYTKFCQIDFLLLAKEITGLALVLIGVAITIFVLSVTLLGRAAKLVKEKRIESEENSKLEFDKDIENLQNEIANNPSNISALKDKISNLEIKKAYNEKQMRGLEYKYNALSLKEAVLVPCGLFLLSLVFGNWLVLISHNQGWKLFSFILAITALIFGVKRILFSLGVISEVSLNTDDHQSEQLQSAFIDALKTIESEKEPKPYVNFIEKPPFIFKINSEATIDFEINLKIPGNKEAKNVDVWFLISKEIELIQYSTSGKPFKQDQGHCIPNANTIRYTFPQVRMHTRTVSKLKIKTTVAGEYRLRYKVNCDNHVEPASADHEVGIIVQE